MRHLARVLTVGVLLPLAGCNTTRWNLFNRPNNPPPPPPGKVPTAAALEDWLNKSAARVETVRCDSLYIRCSQGIKSVGLRGKMICQSPRYFRMSASFLGKQEIDMGSNSQEFWYWIARGDPYQIHCSHKALAEGKVRQMPFPFQPDWIMEALGMAKYQPANRTVVDKKDTWELVEKTRSPQGRLVRKVTVFRASQAPAGMPQVLAHRLIDDATGKEIISATIERVQVQGAAVVPKTVVLWWPQGKIKLKLTLDDITVNRKIARPDQLFVRRPLENIRSYDLAQGRVDDGIRQVEGTYRR
jgi:hypothetical protein